METPDSYKLGSIPDRRSVELWFKLYMKNPHLSVTESLVLLSIPRRLRSVIDLQGMPTKY